MRNDKWHIFFIKRELLQGAAIIKLTSGELNFWFPLCPAATMSTA